MKRAIYFDTETTGVRIDKDKIIEIAAYDPQLDKSYVTFINPGIEIPPEATQIHQITNAMVADAPTFAEAAEEFLKFCEGDAVLIAHNGDSFDKPILESEFKRNKLAVPQWTYLDSLKWARKYRPDLPRHSLQHLREVYGIPANQAHRALDDVIVLHRVFSQMVDDLSMELILELLSAPPPAVRLMPFGKHQGKSLSEVPKDYLRWLRDSGALDKDSNAPLKEALEALSLV